MVLFRRSYLGHRAIWKSDMARFEESKDGPFDWYIETYGLQRLKKNFTLLFEIFLERVLSSISKM